MKPQATPGIPEEMVRVVRAVFPNGNVYIHLRDTLGTIYQDELFEDLYPDRGQPAYAPWRLALVTIFQFTENLTDRQAADVVRSRLDWKYALSLELRTQPGYRTHETFASRPSTYEAACIIACKAARRWRNACRCSGRGADSPSEHLRGDEYIDEIKKRDVGERWEVGMSGVLTEPHRHCTLFEAAHCITKDLIQE